MVFITKSYQDLFGVRSYINAKMFDYYPLRMKLFDYHEWHQLTYPFVKGKEDEWEIELTMFISGVLGDEMFEKFKIY